MILIDVEERRHEKLSLVRIKKNYKQSPQKMEVMLNINYEMFYGFYKQEKYIFLWIIESMILRVFPKEITGNIPLKKVGYIYKMLPISLILIKELLFL